jgi:hypothetical protein
MRIVILFLACIVTACSAARGLNRQALQESFHEHPEMVTDRDIAATMAVTPTLSHPYRLALYFKHKDFPRQPSLRRVEWLSADADRLKQALAQLKDEGLLQQAFVLANSSVQGTTFRDLRQAAARYNAEALLIIDGASAVDRYNNNHAAWYATGIGAYLAHGTESHALFMMEGSLWDVRTGYLLGTQTAEGETTLIGPAPFIDDQAAITEAKDVAFDRFEKEIVDMLRLVREKQRIGK